MQTKEENIFTKINIKKIYTKKNNSKTFPKPKYFVNYPKYNKIKRWAILAYEAIIEFI